MPSPFPRALALAALLLIAVAPAATADTGGVRPVEPRAEGKDSGRTTSKLRPPAVAGNVAKLNRRGMARPPANAPAAVKSAIYAGNRLQRKPYVYGGGHASFKSRGYDCSGTVSFVLHAARVLRSPLASGGLARWGERGRGRWISVYANGGHAYVILAGLRLDTSGSGGRGPRWRPEPRSPSGFAVRHPQGL